MEVYSEDPLTFSNLLFSEIVLSPLGPRMQNLLLCAWTTIWRFDGCESNFLVVFVFSSSYSISWRYPIVFSQPWSFQPTWHIKLNEVINNDNESHHVLIAQDVNSKGAKRFTIFPYHYLVLHYIQTLPLEYICLHEHLKYNIEHEPKITDTRFKNGIRISKSPFSQFWSTYFTKTLHSQKRTISQKKKSPTSQLFTVIFKKFPR